MQIRNQQDLDNLDMSLDLFSEDNWDFMGIDPNETKNFEYFNDVRDTDYMQPVGSKLKYIAPIVLSFTLCLGVLGLGGVWALNQVGYFSDEVYDPQLASVGSTTQVVRVEDGVDADSSVTEETISIFTKYFALLQAGETYVELDTYCQGVSTYNTTYSSFVSGIESNYDTNDCYARAFKLFGQLCKIDTINEVLEKDGVYYVYTNLYLPTEDDITEYMKYNEYNIAKHFTSTTVSESEMFMYLNELNNTTNVTYSSVEYCFKLTYNTSGELVLVDDSQITSLCLSAYSESIAQISNIVMNSL